MREASEDEAVGGRPLLPYGVFEEAAARNFSVDAAEERAKCDV